MEQQTGFPKNVKCEFPVKYGGHFMTVNQADELSAIVTQLLNN